MALCNLCIYTKLQLNASKCEAFLISNKCFQRVGIVANHSKNFQIMYSDLLDKLQNTLSLNYCVEWFKE